MTENIEPIWHGITVGNSTSEEVIAEIGSPTEIEHSDGNDVYVYTGALKWAANRITVRGNIVEIIEEDMSMYFPKEVKLTQFVDQYGIPDRVAWSREDSTLRIAIFPKAGVVVEATAGSLDESQVTRAFYLHLHSQVEIQQLLPTVVSDINPYPNSDVVGPENPWASDFKTYRTK